MNLKFTFFLFFILSSFTVFSQIPVWRANFIDSRFDKKVIVDNCDTFRVIFDFSAPFFTQKMPIEVTLDYHPSTSDYWLNDASLTLTEDNTFWNLEIFLENTPLEGEPDFIRFKMKNADNETEKFTFYFIPEIPAYSLVPQFDEEGFTLCEGSGEAEFLIAPDSETLPVPYLFDYYYFYNIGGITYNSRLFDNSLHVSQWFGNPPTYPGVDVEVRALNCSFPLDPYPVAPTTFSESDTTFCKNEFVTHFGSQVGYPNTSSVYTLPQANANGCDSLLILNLDYLPVNFTMQQVIKLPEETVLFHDSLLTEYGTYIADAQNIHGCDSSEILTLLPLESTNRLTHLPSELSIAKSLCDEQICLPFYVVDNNDYRFIINSAPYEFDELGYCASAGNEITSFTIDLSFIVENTPYRTENFHINGANQADIYFSSFQELLNGLRDVYPAGGFIEGYEDGEIFSYEAGLDIIFRYRNLQTQNQKFLNSASGNQNRILPAGLRLPLQIGDNSLRIEHKTQPFVKDIDIFVYAADIDLDEPILIDYFPELNAKVQFSLQSPSLCGPIISINATCPENWEGIVDYSFTDAGLLTFEALKPYNSTACFEICDAYENCTTVWLNLLFDGLRRDLDDFKYNIFPNPASDLVYVTHEPNINIKKINIFDTRGVQRANSIFIHKNVAEIDVQSYEEGLLFLEIHTDNGEISIEKIVVQR